MYCVTSFTCCFEWTTPALSHNTFLNTCSFFQGLFFCYNLLRHLKLFLKVKSFLGLMYNICFMSMFIKKLQCIDKGIRTWWAVTECTTRVLCRFVFYQLFHHLFSCSVHDDIDFKTPIFARHWMFCFHNYGFLYVALSKACNLSSEKVWALRY